VSAPATRPSRRLATLLALVAGAALLRVISGVGFANYDTLYALAWGGQLGRGQTPAYDVAIAPTPHPLLEVLGLVLSPLPADAVEWLTVAVGFLALAGCGAIVYRLGADWFGRAAGVVAGAVLLTRVPVLSYGVRAYVDLPFLLLVLGALALESRAQLRDARPAGTPVLALLALAGLLRPEAWALSGMYWLYVVVWTRRRDAGGPDAGGLARLTLLTVSAPLAWMLSDLAITGDALWSLTHTRDTAHELGRVTGIANAPEYILRRIGEILRPVVLVGAALGGALALACLRRRALLGAAAGVAGVIVLVAVAAAGLSINTRYAFLTASILCVFCGAGAFGWVKLPIGDPRRRPWALAGAALVVALLASAPGQVRAAHRELRKLGKQQRIQDDLVSLVKRGAVNLRCGPAGVPSHAPIPLLALYLSTSPRDIVDAQTEQILRGVYVDPASREVEETYVLDPHDPHVPVGVPPGFRAVAANDSWLIFRRCP
jgi:hypothetical protein